MDDICACPTQFQAYVPGQDYRVHVVGTEVIACEIRSEADDYRYAPHTIRPFDPPAGVADRCRALTAVLDLAVAGIDLRRTPDGSWVCFEVNPSPGYTFFQDGSTAIERALARLLAGAGTRTQPLR